MIRPVELAPPSAVAADASGDPADPGALVHRRLALASHLAQKAADPVTPASARGEEARLARQSFELARGALASWRTEAAERGDDHTSAEGRELDAAGDAVACMQLLLEQLPGAERATAPLARTGAPSVPATPARKIGGAA